MLTVVNLDDLTAPREPWQCPYVVTCALMKRRNGIDRRCSMGDAGKCSDALMVAYTTLRMPLPSWLRGRDVVKPTRYVVSGGEREMREKMARPLPVRVADGIDPIHGTREGWDAGCRCERCRLAGSVLGTRSQPPTQDEIDAARDLLASVGITVDVVDEDRI